MKKTGEKSLRFGKDIEWDVQILAHKHKDMLCAFSCGSKKEYDGINNFLQSEALKSTSCVSFAIINSNTNDIIALYCLNCSGIMLKSGCFQLCPAVEIKMFALDEKYQHMQNTENPDDGKLSDSILSFVIDQIRQFTDNHCGAEHVVLYSLPSAVNFYSRNGFMSFVELMVPDKSMFLEGCIPMFMPL